MASLFEHLLQTMPLAGARHAMCVNPADKSREVPFAQVPAAKARRYLRYLDADEDYEAKIPPVEPKLQPHHQPLWWWTHRGAELAKVSDIYCRVRDADFVGHKVLDSVEWGLEEESGEFKQAIRVTNLCGVPVELPLTAEFVAQKWVAVAGWMPKDTEHLWPLEALHDRSLVIAFVYELDPATGQPKPMAKGGAATPEEAADLQDAKDAATALRKGPLLNIPDWPCFRTEGDDCLPTLEVPWGFRILKGDFMAADPQASVVGGEVGEECKADISAARILVVLSLTCTRERSDFDPVSVVGMARIYPHLMVKASIPLSKIDASIRYNRPEKTTKFYEAGRDMTKTCCARYDASDNVVNALFVTDVNHNDSVVPGPLPFWSNMFSYYQPAAFDALGRERFHMVRTDRLAARSDSTTGISRDVVLGPSAMDTISKVSRQGEFDNLHLAPLLRLVGVKEVAFPRPNAASGDLVKLPVDREHLRLDQISMAPFCAHDCLHTHWRWGAFADERWNLGWDETGPYRVAGAPMVPVNQDTWIWLRSRHQMTYHVVVGEDPAHEIRPGVWQVLMYHGSGFVAGITKELVNLAASVAFEAFGAPPYFFDAEDNRILSPSSTALLYWRARYGAILDDGGAVWVIERIRWTPESLRTARHV